MTAINVNHAALDQAAADMRKAVDDINNRLDRLENELKPLKEEWAGQQKGAYEEAKMKWDTAINEMNALLRDTHLAVTVSREEYQAADKSGAKRFM